MPLLPSWVKIFQSDRYDLPLPKGHRFPMSKYKMVKEALIKNQIAATNQVIEAPLAKVEAILAIHDHHYYNAIVSGTLSLQDQKKIGFPWSPIMIDRSRASVGGL